MEDIEKALKGGAIIESVFCVDPPENSVKKVDDRGRDSSPVVVLPCNTEAAGDSDHSSKSSETIQQKPKKKSKTKSQKNLSVAFNKTSTSTPDSTSNSSHTPASTSIQKSKSDCNLLNVCHMYIVPYISV